MFLLKWTLKYRIIYFFLIILFKLTLIHCTEIEKEIQEKYGAFLKSQPFKRKSDHDVCDAVRFVKSLTLALEKATDYKEIEHLQVMITEIVTRGTGVGGISKRQANESENEGLKYAILIATAAESKWEGKPLSKDKSHFVGKLNLAENTGKLSDHEIEVKKLFSQSYELLQEGQDFPVQMSDIFAPTSDFRRWSEKQMSRDQELVEQLRRSPYFLTRKVVAKESEFNPLVECSSKSLEFLQSNPLFFKDLDFKSSSLKGVLIALSGLNSEQLNFLKDHVEFFSDTFRRHKLDILGYLRYYSFKALDFFSIFLSSFEPRYKGEKRSIADDILGLNEEKIDLLKKYFIQFNEMTGTEKSDILARMNRFPEGKVKYLENCYYLFNNMDEEGRITLLHNLGCLEEIHLEFLTIYRHYFENLDQVKKLKTIYDMWVFKKAEDIVSYLDKDLNR